MNLVSVSLKYLPTEFEGDELKQIDAKVTFASDDTDSEVTFSKSYNENVFLNKTLSEILDNLRTDCTLTLRRV